MAAKYGRLCARLCSRPLPFGKFLAPGLLLPPPPRLDTLPNLGYTSLIFAGFLLAARGSNAFGLPATRPVTPELTRRNPLRTGNTPVHRTWPFCGLPPPLRRHGLLYLQSRSQDTPTAHHAASEQAPAAEDPDVGSALRRDYHRSLHREDVLRGEFPSSVSCPSIFVLPSVSLSVLSGVVRGEARPSTGFTSLPRLCQCSSEFLTTSCHTPNCTSHIRRESSFRYLWPPVVRRNAAFLGQPQAPCRQITSRPLL